MQTVLSTPATKEPVTLEETKVFLKVTNTSEDTTITGLITSAREACEKAARITISPCQWTIFARAPHYSHGDDFGLTRRLNDPDKVWHGVRLPRPPAASIASVNYMKLDGQRELADPRDYRFDLNLGSLFWNDRTKLGAWENTHLEIVYAAGYPVKGEVVGCPRDIKIAILQTVAHFYENRGDDDVPGMAIDRLSPYWQTATRRGR